ncbi:Rx, N-terminal [Dillenia turbinata]|uniref:Rx, N-terminal n=1 Tax=Dillenia turbinata TaxID=194707 RepID=A0AAN8VUN2_9MAGN
MGEPLLAAYLQSLLDKLAPGPLMNFAIQQGFDSELRKWRSMLRKIKLVLGDAEEKQMNDIEVKRWLDDLLILAYDADDALDDLDCEALQQEDNSSSDPAASNSQLLDMLPLIKKIAARFQYIEEQKIDLGLEAKHGVRSSIINKRPETTSLLDTSEIVGREHDVEAILKLMRLSETTKAEAHASPTLGMAGSGCGYCGVTLPNWIGDSSYSKLVELSLINCERCKWLPSLGQLPLLQKLTIKGMLEIEILGTELYGEASPHGQPFPSLTQLCIENCKNLRTLPDAIMSSNSNLQVLEIWDCTSLESFPSGVLPSTLKGLSICNCRKLESISEMLLGPTSLDSVYFKEYPNLKSLPECLCTNLTLLTIDRCESIESLPETPNLTHLEVRYCENLKYLPSNLPKLTSLLYLCVVGCDNLASLPEGGLPSGLQHLEFGPCAKMNQSSVEEKLDKKVEKLNALQFLPLPIGPFFELKISQARLLVQSSDPPLILLTFDQFKQSQECSTSSRLLQLNSLSHEEEAECFYS